MLNQQIGTLVGQIAAAQRQATMLGQFRTGGVERGEHNLALVNLIKVSAAIGVPASELLRRTGP